MFTATFYIWRPSASQAVDISCQNLVRDPRVIDALEDVGLDRRNNIKMDLREVGCKDADCSQLTVERVQCQAVEYSVTNLWVL
jgi:hypothetical protein